MNADYMDYITFVKMESKIIFYHVLQIHINRIPIVVSFSI